MKLEKIEYAPGDTRYLFHCPGCGNNHTFSVPRWYFNGDMEKPTFSPSLRYYTTRPEGEKNVDITLCHLFVQNGKIVFCDDSPHHLAGKTVDMVEMEP